MSAVVSPATVEQRAYVPEQTWPERMTLKDTHKTTHNVSQKRCRNMEKWLLASGSAIVWSDAEFKNIGIEKPTCIGAEK